jgi:hypothetical protein
LKSAAREQSSGIEGHYGSELGQTLDRYAKLANEFPEAAVIMSFKELDETILSLGMAVGLSERTKPIDIIRTLARRPSDYSVGFDESAVAAYQSLQRARNAAAHGGGADRIGPGAALDFVAQARVMTESVKHLLEHVPKRATEKKQPRP